MTDGAAEVKVKESLRLGAFHAKTHQGERNLSRYLQMCACLLGRQLPKQANSNRIRSRDYINSLPLLNLFVYMCVHLWVRDEVRGQLLGVLSLPGIQCRSWDLTSHWPNLLTCKNILDFCFVSWFLMWRTEECMCSVLRHWRRYWEQYLIGRALL